MKTTYYADDYKKKLADFMALVNPKPTEKQLEQLRQSYLQKRESHETKSSL